jgi:hypothetical protein
MCYIDIAPSAFREDDTPVSSLVDFLTDPSEQAQPRYALETRLTATVMHAQISHRICNPEDPTVLARYLMAVAKGLAVSAQTGVPMAELRRKAEFAVTTLMRPDPAMAVAH